MTQQPTADIPTETVVTPEQRAAWLRLSGSPDAPFEIGGSSPDKDAALIAPLLPSSLTAPEPALPTEPGLYASDATMTEVYYDGETWTEVGSWAKLANPRRFAPLRRLVPERPPITREQAFALVTAYAEQMVDEHEHADAILALANGAVR